MAKNINDIASSCLMYLLPGLTEKNIMVKINTKQLSKLTKKNFLFMQ